MADLELLEQVVSPGAATASDGVPSSLVSRPSGSYRRATHAAPPAERAFAVTILRADR